MVETQAFNVAASFIVVLLICVALGFLSGRASKMSDRRAAFFLMTPVIFWVVWLFLVEIVLKD